SSWGGRATNRAKAGGRRRRRRAPRATGSEEKRESQEAAEERQAEGAPDETVLRGGPVAEQPGRARAPLRSKQVALRSVRTPARRHPLPRSARKQTDYANTTHSVKWA